MTPLTNRDQKTGTFSKEKFKDTNDKKFHRVRDHCFYTDKYRTAPHSTSNLRH